MARKSIEDVMNEIEDFLNSCKTSALSSNKIVVPRDEFDELFGDLKVKIPAEIDRCKKIMRNKEAILMDARKTADGILAQATAQANQMVSQTEVMNLANQKAYETVEMARVQANDILAQAVAEANEIRLGSMQYTNDIMTGIRDYVEATMNAERANYENLIATLNNDYIIANANLEEVQRQIVEFTGDPNSVQQAPQFKTSASGKNTSSQPKAKNSVVQKVKQAVGSKEEKKEEQKEEQKPPVNIPDFIANSEKVVSNENPAAAKKEVQNPAPVKNTNATVVANAQQSKKSSVTATSQNGSATMTISSQVAGAKTANAQNTNVAASRQNAVNQTATAKVANVPGVANTVEQAEAGAPKKVKKKIVKKRNPVLQTPQTAQETVAKTLEVAAAAKVDKTVYKANGEQAREVPPMEGRVKRGPRVGRGMVDETAKVEQPFETTNQNLDSVNTTESVKSMGVVDDYTMEKKF